MNNTSRFLSWIRAVFRRQRVETEMREEIRFHLESSIADLVRSGVPEAEARRQARLAFGPQERCKEECREALGLRFLDELTGDLRYSLRQLRRSPGFTAVATISLALGIGACTAVFSLMEAALWRPLPVDDPADMRLLSWVSGRNRVMRRIDGISSRASGGTYAFSYPVFLALEQQSDTFEALFAFKAVDRLTAIVEGTAEVVSGELVTGRYFEGLRLRPALGRPLGTQDDDPANEAAGVISDGYWARRFGRDPSAIGRRIIINGTPVTVVGITPPWFSSAQIDTKPDIFLPLRLQPIVRPERRNNETALRDPERWWLSVAGRLRPGIADRQAEAELDAIFRRAVLATLPGRTDRDRPRLVLERGTRGLDLLSGQYSQPLLVLMVLVALLLLIACTNVASLLLGRALVRDREMSVRLALGASPWRVGRQLLTEGCVLAGIAGTGGILLGFWLRDSIPALMAASWRPSPFHAEFNWRVLTWSVLVTSATGILFSLAPVWRVTRRDMSPAFTPRAPSLGTASRAALGGSLVAAQIGLSILLLTGAGLFVRTLWNLGDVELGFRPDRVLLFAVDPPLETYQGERRSLLFRTIQEQVSAIPGVERASHSTRALVAFGRSITGVNPDILAPADRYASAWALGVGHGFFDTMGIPVVAGRTFHERDGAFPQPVAVVNQQFARQFYPGDSPVGKPFRTGNTILHVIGVVGDTKYDQLASQVPPTFYTYLHQAADRTGSMTFCVRTTGEPGALVPAIRDVVRAIDPTVAMFDVRTQNQQIASTIVREKLLATLSVLFALLAATLAAVGIFGIVANDVARRTHEMGIRIALGATRRWLIVMVLRETALVGGAGIALGLAATLPLVRYVRSMLFGIEPIDWPTITVAVLVMLGVAMLAAWIPARRASRLDPLVALRHE